jgi:hypothetical protein
VGALLFLPPPPSLYLPSLLQKFRERKGVGGRIETERQANKVFSSNVPKEFLGLLLAGCSERVGLENEVGLVKVKQW